MAQIQAGLESKAEDVTSKQITHLLFWDVETQGLDPKVHAVLEVALAVVHLGTRQIVSQYESLVAPVGQYIMHGTFPFHTHTGKYEWIIPDFHGSRFQDVDWSTAKTMDRILDEIGMMLSGATLAGQNPKFDRDFIMQAYDVLGRRSPKTDYHQFDVASPSLFLMMSGRVPGVSLKHTREWAGFSGEQSHRAMQDVEETIGVFWKHYDTYTAGLDTMHERELAFYEAQRPG
jgi:DNA polymerase III epsilon subunit-like protein